MDLCAAATPMGLFFGRLANFINAELWGRAERRALGDGVSRARGPLPRHPSQLYEALLEGLVLFAVLWWLTHRRRALAPAGADRRRVPAGLRAGALVLRVLPRARPRPRLHARSVHRRHLLFPADDPGRHLHDARGRAARAGSRPMPAADAGEAAEPAAGDAARAHPPATARCPVDEYMRACLADPEHGYCAAARRHRRRRRLRHGARDQPGVRRADRAVVRGRLAEHGAARAAAPGRARAGPRHADARCAARRAGRAASSSRRRACTWSRSARPCARCSAQTLARSQHRARPSAGTRPRTRCRTGPAIVVANEFLDALPIRQLVFARRRLARARRRPRCGMARCGSRRRRGRLAPRRRRRAAAPGDIVELRAGEDALLGDACRARARADRRAVHRLRPGRAALRRYAAGRAPPRLCRSAGRTRAAPTSRRMCSSRASRDKARAAGLAADGPITQAEFLGRLGIAERAARLMAANPAQAGEIEAGVQRLISPTGMGAALQGAGGALAAASAAAALRLEHGHAEAPASPTALRPCRASRTAFSRAHGGVSQGIYASLNCGLGSKDDAAAVRENRARVAPHLGARDLSAPTRCTAPTRVVVDEAWPDAERAAGRRHGHGDARPRRRRADRRLRAGAVRRPARRASSAAAHAGWRGALAGVLEATIAAMERLGARRGAHRAAVGPCIGQAAYEVGRISSSHSCEHDPASAPLFHARRSRRAAAFRSGGLCRATAWRGRRRRAERSRPCTYAQSEDFFSYRRSQARKEPDYGRQISAIVLT